MVIECVCLHSVMEAKANLISGENHNHATESPDGKLTQLKGRLTDKIHVFLIKPISLSVLLIPPGIIKHGIVFKMYFSQSKWLSFCICSSWANKTVYAWISYELMGVRHLTLIEFQGDLDS